MADNKAVEKLSKRQKEVYDSIGLYTAVYGYPPSVRDICNMVGLKSTSAVHAHLISLKKQGLIRRTAKLNRSVVIV